MFNLVIAIVFLVSNSIQASELIPPAGWKLPQPVTDSGCDRSKSDLFSVKADFDGDGKEDFAQLLTKANGSELSLWVKLASVKKPILVTDSKSVDGKHDLGIGLVAPGTYKTLCGKGYEECKRASDAELKLELPAIDLFKCESANRYLYWSIEKKKFIEEWMSD